MINCIYTYYDNIHPADDAYQNILIELWKLSWKKNGFNPIVLTKENAVKHPRYSKFKKEIEKIHLSLTGNKITKYGLSCFERWLAYGSLNLDKPFYVSDYDIINNGFKPQNLQIDEKKISFLDTLCPSIAIGNSSLFNFFIEDILTSSKSNLFKQAYKNNSLKNFHDQEFLFLKFMTKNLDYNKGDYNIYEPEQVVSIFFVDKKDILQKYKILHVSHSCCGSQKEKFPDLEEKEIRIFLIKQILN
jgi:hypothetical protein